jgi:hypothetical protein
LNLPEFVQKYILQQSDNQSNLDDYARVQKLVKIK